MNRAFRGGLPFLIFLFLPQAPVHAEPRTASRAEQSPSDVSVSELVRMVQQAARRLDDKRIDKLIRRARVSGLIPALKLGADRGLKQDLSSTTTSDAERSAAAVADDLSLEASLTFELPRLVFAPEEVRLVSVERWLANDQRKLIEEAIRIYFQRRRLLLEQSRAAQPDPEIAINIDELEAVLDAITDGAFGRARRGGRR